MKKTNLFLLCIIIILSIFLTFSLSKNKKEEMTISSKEAIEEPELFNRDEYPYYFFIDKEIKIDNLPGEEKIVALRLMYKYKPNGEYMPTYSTYLLTVGSHFGTPMLIDEVDGYSIEVEIKDINNDQKNELVVYYHAGSSQTILQVYEIVLNEYGKVGGFMKKEEMKVQSNMGNENIVIENGYITTKYWESCNEGTKVTTKRYLIKKDSFDLVLTEEEIYEM